MYELYLLLQHLALTSPESALRQLSVQSRADLILRKAKYIARQKYTGSREEGEDVHIPS